MVQSSKPSKQTPRSDLDLNRGRDYSDFNLIRHELNKLQELPPWGRPQEDRWDQLSKFVYRIKTLQGVRRQAQAQARAAGLPVEAFEAYTIRRWFNHHTHNQILNMFLAHPDVQPEENQRHHTIDFYLRGIPFDLKISLFPKAYPESIAYAQQNPHHLARWQYEYQSKQGRYHAENRFFIILLYSARPESSWQLRRDFEALETLIQDFLATPTLLGLTLTHQHTRETYHPWVAVLFHVK